MHRQMWTYGATNTKRLSRLYTISSSTLIATTPHGYAPSSYRTSDCSGPTPLTVWRLADCHSMWSSRLATKPTCQTYLLCLTPQPSRYNILKRMLRHKAHFFYTRHCKYKQNKNYIQASRKMKITNTLFNTHTHTHTHTPPNDKQE